MFTQVPPSSISTELSPPSADSYGTASVEEMASFRVKHADLLLEPAIYDGESNYINELIVTNDVVKDSLTPEEHAAFVQHLLLIVRDYNNNGCDAIPQNRMDAHDPAMQIGDALFLEELTAETRQELANIYLTTAKKFQTPERIDYELLIDSAKLSLKFRQKLAPLSQENLLIQVETFELCLNAHISFDMWLEYYKEWSELASCVRTTYLAYSHYKYDIKGEEQSIAHIMLETLISAAEQALPNIYTVSTKNTNLHQFYEYLLEFCRHAGLDDYAERIKKQFDSLVKFIFLLNEIENKTVEMDCLEHDPKLLAEFEKARVCQLNHILDLAQGLNEYELKRPTKNSLIIQNYTNIMHAKCLLGDAAGALKVYKASYELCKQITYRLVSEEDIASLSAYRHVVMVAMQFKGRLNHEYMEHAISTVKDLVYLMYPNKDNLDNLASLASDLFAKWKRDDCWAEILDFARGLIESFVKKMELYAAEARDEDYDNPEQFRKGNGVISCLLLIQIINETLHDLPRGKCAASLKKYTDLCELFHRNFYESANNDAASIIYVQRQVERDIKVVNEYVRQNPAINKARIDELIDFLKFYGHRTQRGDLYVMSGKVLAKVKKSSGKKVPEAYLLTVFDIPEILKNTSLVHGLYQIFKQKFLTEPVPQHRPSNDEQKTETAVIKKTLAAVATVPPKAEVKVGVAEPAPTAKVTTPRNSAPSVSVIKTQMVEEDLRRKKTEKEAREKAESARREARKKTSDREEVERLKAARKEAHAKKSAPLPSRSGSTTPILLSPKPTYPMLTTVLTRKVDSTRIMRAHIIYLDAALSALCNVKILLASDLSPTVKHYALLLSIEKSYKAFAYYSLVGKTDEKKQADVNAISLKNSSPAAVLAFAEALTRNLPDLASYHDSQRKKLICALGLAKPLYDVNEYVFFIEETNCYREFRKFFSGSPVLQLNGSLDERLQGYITDLLVLVNQIREANKAVKFFTEYNVSQKASREFWENHGAQMQAIAALVILVKNCGMQNGETEKTELKSFISYCQAQGDKIQMDMNPLQAYDAFDRINKAIFQLEVKEVPLTIPLTSPKMTLNPNASAFKPLSIEIDSNPGTPETDSSIDDFKPSPSPQSEHSAAPTFSPNASPLDMGFYSPPQASSMLRAQEGFSFFSNQNSRPTPSPTQSTQASPFSYGFNLLAFIQTPNSQAIHQSPQDGTETDNQIFSLKRQSTM